MFTCRLKESAYLSCCCMVCMAIVGSADCYIIVYVGWLCWRRNQHLPEARREEARKQQLKCCGWECAPCRPPGELQCDAVSRLQRPDCQGVYCIGTAAMVSLFWSARGVTDQMLFVIHAAGWAGNSRCWPSWTK